VLWAYERLLHSARRLGQPPGPGRTPAEFQAALLHRLSHWERRPWSRLLPEEIGVEVERLTALFIRRQYSPHPLTAREQERARETWQRISRPLWLLGTLKRFRGNPD
jgi:branched-subunit amino acid aminotransferase/4-amino-4-deoxychorismate lyase